MQQRFCTITFWSCQLHFADWNKPSSVYRNQQRRPGYRAKYVSGYLFKWRDTEVMTDLFIHFHCQYFSARKLQAWCNIEILRLYLKRRKTSPGRNSDAEVAPGAPNVRSSFWGWLRKAHPLQACPKANNSPRFSATWVKEKNTQIYKRDFSVNRKCYARSIVAREIMNQANLATNIYIERKYTSEKESVS